MSPRVGIPQTDGIVVTPSAATCDSVCIGTERHTMDTTRIPSERADMSTRVSIPQADGIVPTSTCDSVSIRTKRYA